MCILLSSLLRPIDKNFIEEKLLVLTRYDGEKKIKNIKKLCHNLDKYQNISGIDKIQRTNIFFMRKACQ